ncbi:MAG: hypothetical protein JWN74_159 [Acidobacteriaceae bacterium]|nr:hypothetical protein [Acidobacteriaceae bacterium]
MTPTLDTSNLLNGVIGNAVFAFLCWAGRWLANRLERRSPLYRRFVLLLLALSWILLDIIFYKTLHGFAFLCASILSFGIAGTFVWKELDQFWSIGLIGADRQISTGIDFKRSLNLCSNSLDFLGIGAGKLTREMPSFESALQRCHRSHTPIRFLLSRPNNPELQSIARQAGRDPEEYQRTVRQSLRVIAQQRNDRARNIEVRFYDRLPLFRLMFIDGWFCLASHYVFGEGEGSQWPQLHVRRIESQRDVSSLYEPFRRYFEELWNKATQWDFVSDLEP